MRQICLFFVVIVGVAIAVPLSSQPRAAAAACDVIIAGGSLASLAAAVSAADYSPDVTVCYLEPTDWPGGQLTASAVPAVDFGPHNRDGSANVARSFASFLFGPSMPGDVNLGNCWVNEPPGARVCFLTLSCRSPASVSSPILPTKTSCNPSSPPGPTSRRF